MDPAGYEAVQRRTQGAGQTPVGAGEGDAGPSPGGSDLGDQVGQLAPVVAAGGMEGATRVVGY
jgi:hypothetical protein